ncbi:MAG: hypothetical protein LBU73_06030 [Helicobacteraceae bacterium]|jgi:hypothetical protein|nr:hypothetical protein [Helicobacteraceae bacterium]
MKNLLIILLLTITAIAEYPAKVYQYAFSGEELAENAEKTAMILKEKNIHLGVIKNSDIFEGDAGLTALKLHYIEIFAANAKTLQFLVPNLWDKLNAVKNGDSRELARSLKRFNFVFVGARFYKDKTMIILASNAIDKETLKILADNL